MTREAMTRDAMTQLQDTPAVVPSPPAAREPLPTPAVDRDGGSSTRTKAVAYRVLSRAAYWSPVFAALVLFAQVSILGLRPAMAESRRLAAAEEMLLARHQRAAAENSAVSAQLFARQDPIFRERQRRLRLIEPFAVPPTSRAVDEK
jgi:hypothetical protein